MKKIILVVFFTLFVSLAFSDEVKSETKPQMVFTNILSPGLFSTLGFGTGKVSSDLKKENLVIFHAGIAPMFFGCGIYSQTRFFKNTSRTGLFYTIDLGVDMILGVAADPGGGGAAIIAIPFPNIAAGIGYSEKIGKRSYFRISLDVGLKAVISNLNLSITF